MCGCTEGKCSVPLAGCARTRLCGLQVLFGKEGLCPCVSPAAGTDTELHHFTEPSTHFYIFTVAQGQGCWLEQAEVKQSSEISGYSFAPWELVEAQVDAAPAGLQDISSAQGLAQQDASLVSQKCWC